MIKDKFRDCERLANPKRYMATRQLMPALCGRVLDADQPNTFWRGWDETENFKLDFLDDFDFNRRHFTVQERAIVYLEQLYDVVTSFEVLEHLMNPLHYLDQCRKSMPRKGKLILTTPISYWPPQLFWYKKHFYEMPWSRLAALLDNAGFKVTRRERIRVFPGFGPVKLVRFLGGAWWYIEAEAI